MSHTHLESLYYGDLQDFDPSLVTTVGEVDESATLLVVAIIGRGARVTSGVPFIVEAPYLGGAPYAYMKPVGPEFAYSTEGGGVWVELWYCATPLTGVQVDIVVPNAGTIPLAIGYSLFASDSGASGRVAADSASDKSTDPLLNLAGASTDRLGYAVLGSASESGSWWLDPDDGTQAYEIGGGAITGGAQYTHVAEGTWPAGWSDGPDEDWGIIGGLFVDSACGAVSKTLPSLSSSSSAKSTDLEGKETRATVATTRLVETTLET